MRFAPVRAGDATLSGCERAVERAFFQRRHATSVITVGTDSDVVIEIGGLPIGLSTDDPSFIEMLR
jgi:hypothetical protein